MRTWIEKWQIPFFSCRLAWKRRWYITFVVDEHEINCSIISFSCYCGYTDNNERQQRGNWRIIMSPMVYVTGVSSYKLLLCDGWSWHVHNKCMWVYSVCDPSEICLYFSCAISAIFNNITDLAAVIHLSERSDRAYLRPGQAPGHHWLLYHAFDPYCHMKEIHISLSLWHDYFFSFFLGEFPILQKARLSCDKNLVVINHVIVNILRSDHTWIARFDFYLILESGTISHIGNSNFLKNKNHLTHDFIRKFLSAALVSRDDYSRRYRFFLFLFCFPSCTSVMKYFLLYLNW